MSSVWSQLWHVYSRFSKGFKGAILVIDKDILCMGRHVVFKEMEHNSIAVLFIYIMVIIFYCVSVMCA
jgi:hypothetical protein